MKPFTRQTQPSLMKKERRALYGPARTSPEAVAEALARITEFKRQQYAWRQLAASPPLPASRQFERPVSAKPRQTEPYAKDERRPDERLQDRHYQSRQGQSSRTASAHAEARFLPPDLAAKATAMAIAWKGAARAFLETLRVERVPASGAQTVGEPLSHGFERALGWELHRGKRMLAIAGIVVLGWAGLVPLSGAVIVAGSLVVHSSVKKVQHPAGGIVTDIFVRNGSKVEAGDPLAKLDETAARTNLQVIARQLDEARLRIARLDAERDGSEKPRWPRDMAAELTPAERARLLASEQDFFAARSTARRGQQELAESRIKQLEKQIAGLEAQFASNTRQMDITAVELKTVETLLQQKLVTLQRATTLQREAARLDGSDGQIASQIAETRNKVNETRLQALQTEQNFKAEVMRDLGEAKAKEGELLERHLAAEDLLKRTLIRAPSSGTVHELAIHTVGGVVTPAEVLMVVVPDSDALEVDARLNPEKIDQVHVGQAAYIRLSAFNTRTTPELTGTVEFVSADIIRDPQSGNGHYEIRIALPSDEVHRLGKRQLIPGMPAEAFLQTGSRTMLSYLFKPITDQLSRMFREP